MPDTRSAVIGRERHLREIALLIEGVAASRGYGLVLSGEAGAGKTKLAEEAAASASGAGVAVAWVTCWRNAAAPLSVWTDVLSATGAATVPGDVAGDADPEHARARRVLALAHDALREFAARPTLIVVDDIQWADPLSVHAFSVLVGLVRSAPLGVVCTLRDEAGAGVEGLDGLLRSSRTIEVPPLTKSELGALASDLTGTALTPAALARLHDRTGGNVLFAKELLQGGSNDPAAARAEGLRASSSAMTIFADRVSQLSPPTQRMLQAASVIGRKFRLDVLAEALSTDVETLLDLIGEAEVAGLVRNQGLAGFAFGHPLVAEACYQSGGLPQRVRLHREVAEAMERLRARGLAIPAVEIAHHFANAAAAGVADKAAEYAALAGAEDMAQLAYEDAVRDFSLALHARELCPADDSARAELLLALGDAHAATGDRSSARTAYESVAQLARQHGWPDTFGRAALGVGSGPGGFEVPPFDDHQVALLEEAARMVSGALRPQVLARLSVALALDPRAVSRRAQLSNEAIALARASRDSLALGYALASWCDVNPGPDAVDDRLVAADEILVCAAAANDTRLELLGRRFRVVALLETGRIDDVDAEVAAYAASADRVGEPTYSWYVPLWQGTRAAMDGRLDDAARFRARAEVVGAAAHSDNAVMLTSSQHGMLSAELRDSAEAVAFFERFLTEFPDYALQGRPALAYVLAASNQLERAREIVELFEPGDYTVDALGSEFLTTLFMVAHTAWMVGRRDPAVALYDLMLPYRSRFAIDGIGGYVIGSVERTLGVLAALVDDRDRAREHFSAALDHHRRVRSPLLVAGTLRDWGLCLGEEELVREATERFRALGVTTAIESGARAAPAPLTDVASFRRDGDGWLVGWGARRSHVRHTKGMADIGRLLASGGVEMHVLDLVDVGPTLDSRAPGEQIDSTAREQYRARLGDIESDLADADLDGDVARADRLHIERDALIAELTGAYGLGGRARRRGDSSERARSAVTQRIRDAVARIHAVDPDLGDHLKRAIRTGTFCAYDPPSPVEWDL